MMYDYDYLDEKAKPYGGIKKIFDELSDYADEFIIGYLESRCGCRVSKDDVIKEAAFTSVWAGYEITTTLVLKQKDGIQIGITGINKINKRLTNWLVSFSFPEFLCANIESHI